MRIAVFHHLNSGGSLRALNYQIRHLRQLGHHITVYTTTTTRFPHFASYITYLYFHLPRLHSKLAHEIDSKHFDVVHLAPDHLTQSPYLLRYLKTPSLYYCQEPKRDLWETEGFRHTTPLSKLRHLLHLPLKSIDRKNAHHATTILANSNYSKKVQESIYHRKIHINYLGVDRELFTPAPQQSAPFGPTTTTILSVGTFLPHKNFDLLIRALSFFPHSIRPTLTLAGNGGSPAYLSYLRSLASETEVRLQLHIHPSDSLLIKLYRSSTLFAAPFFHEPFGLVALESLACGTPVVATNEGGLPEIARPVHRTSTPPPISLVPRSPEAFVLAIQSHLYLLPTQRARLSANCITLASRWSWESSVRELEKYLSRTSNHRATPHPTR